MTTEIETLVLYRLSRAKESLDEAKILLDSGHAHTFLNRLYYAVFYAVNAVLLVKGFSSAKHSGVRALLHKELVKTGLLSEYQGRLYDRLFDTRQKADYADLVKFDIHEIAPWLGEVEQFLEAIEILLKSY